MASTSFRSNSALLRIAAFCCVGLVLASVPGLAISQDAVNPEASPKEGTGVSYAELINLQFGKGIAPEQNALAKIYEAIGPRPEGTFQGEEYFRRLGIPVPPDSGKYLQRFGDGLTGNAQQDAIKRYSNAMGSPWTEQQYPDLATWLKNNEQALQIVVEATQRPGWYYPVLDKVGEDGQPVALIATLLPHIQMMRELARTLLIRANLHVANNEPEKAWQDLMACHRLARLTSRGPTLIDFLVGVAINSMASHAELRLLSDANLSEQQVDQFLSDLEKLPPMPQVSVNVNVTERMMFLDSVTLMSKGQLNVAELLGDGPTEDNPFDQPILRSLIDWDVVRKKGNEAYDDVVAALEEKDVEKRRAALVEIDQKWVDTKTRFTTSSLLKDYLRTGSAGSVASDRMADAMIALFIPAVNAIDAAQLRCLQTNQNLLLAFHLQKFKAKNGSYPESLEALEKSLGITVLPDLCNGQPLNYTRTNDGYVLYSVGTNGVDERGRSWTDLPAEGEINKADDIIVRMPVPLPKPE